MPGGGGGQELQPGLPVGTGDPWISLQTPARLVRTKKTLAANPSKMGLEDCSRFLIRDLTNSMLGLGVLGPEDSQWGGLALADPETGPAEKVGGLEAVNTSPKRI